MKTLVLIGLVLSGVWESCAWGESSLSRLRQRSTVNQTYGTSSGAQYANSWDYTQRTGGTGSPVGPSYNGLAGVQVKPGQVLKFNNFSSNSGSGTQHWVRVERVNPDGSIVTRSSAHNGSKQEHIAIYDPRSFRGQVTVFSGTGSYSPSRYRVERSSPEKAPQQAEVSEMPKEDNDTCPAEAEAARSKK